MSDSEEFRLKIEAYSPDTMPMARLAEYLGELAEMLGESTSVHFVKLEPGSTSVVHKIQREAIPKIRHRTRAIARGIGARDAVRAYYKINRMVREDNGRATWQSSAAEVGNEAEVVIFPGKDEAETKISTESRFGSVDGEILRVGGVKKFVPILLRYENDEFSGCYADKEVAKSLAKRLFEPVRLFGIGRWNRDENGAWKLDKFRVNTFAPLKETTASEAFATLRAMDLGWDQHAFNDLTVLRADEAEDVNGSI